MLLPTVVRRFIGSLALIWLVLTLTFVLVRVAPGDPAMLLIPPSASAADASRLRAELGLDRSLAVQYARWSKALLRGNFGESFALKRPVVAVIRDALPVSASLGAVSLALTFLIGVPIGMIQARRRGTATDRILTIVSVGLYSAPSFWLSLSFVGVFTYGAATWARLRGCECRPSEFETPGAMLTGGAMVADTLRHAVLPVMILALIGAAGIARYARTTFADMLGADFVRTARAGAEVVAPRQLSARSGDGAAVADHPVRPGPAGRRRRLGVRRVHFRLAWNGEGNAGRDQRAGLSRDHGGDGGLCRSRDPR